MATNFAQLPEPCCKGGHLETSAHIAVRGGDHNEPRVRGGSYYAQGHGIRWRQLGEVIPWACRRRQTSRSLATLMPR
jgi:hypothetical protein